MSPYGFRFSSVLTGTKSGARLMARSDAIIATYRTIHIARLPNRTDVRIVDLYGGGIAARRLLHIEIVRV